MPETTPPPADLSAIPLAEIARALAERRLPPVEAWNPTHCGDSAMRIARDGTWYHEGSPIGRMAMVRLFASILRREPDGGYVLVTPGEKLDIAVEDVPFVAVEVRSEGTGRDRRLAFRLNTDEVVIAGPDNALRLDETADGPTPYLHVRRGLDALVSRSVYYELATLALDEEGDPAGLWSDGAFFAFGPLRVTLAERLRRALGADVRHAAGYVSEDTGDLAALFPNGFTPAAVLVPIVARPEPGVLLTLRNASMRQHAGQIAFPGGRIDPGDAGPVAAALREAEEEIGLPRDAVTVIGTADHYYTITGYEVTPVVGLIEPDTALMPHPGEVEDIFEVPLDFLLEPANHATQAVDWEGHQRRYFEITWNERRIWGATAAMIVNLSRRMATAR